MRNCNNGIIYSADCFHSDFTCLVSVCWLTAVMTHASTKTQHRKENSFIRGTQDCEGAQCMVPAFYSILNVQSTCVAPLSKQILHSEILRDACCTSECSCPSLYSQACISASSHFTCDSRRSSSPVCPEMWWRGYTWSYCHTSDGQ